MVVPEGNLPAAAVRCGVVAECQNQNIPQQHLCCCACSGACSGACSCSCPCACSEATTPSTHHTWAQTELDTHG